jgi:tRNA modification GTPase
MEKISQSALLVYVYDVTQITIDELNDDIASLQGPGINIIVVANKVDLLDESESSKVGKSERLTALFNDDMGQEHLSFLLPDSPTSGLSDLIGISAKNNFHIDDLKQKIYNTAIKDKLTGDQTLITNIRHLEALQKTEEALIRVLNGMDTVTSDFLAMDIKMALHYLGEITGVVTTDDLLENIFSKFCIGK